VNAGTIGETGGGTAAFYTGVGFAKGFAGLLVDEPGAVFIGKVDGGNTIGATATSTLELASGASAGTLAGLGAQFVDFARITVDAGAAWTLAGANTLPAGAALGGGGTLVDAGTLISGSTIDLAVTLANGAGLTNQAGGTVSANPAGAAVYAAGAAYVTNAGSIEGGANGVALAGGSLTNSSGASITGQYGVRLSGGMLTNAGTIVGTAGTAVSLGGGSNLLAVDPGAVFTGTVVGSASGSNTLELAPGASTGTLSGLGANYLNFGSIAFDAGAEWLLAGNTVGLASGQIISGFAMGDTIELIGLTETIESYAGGTLTLGGDAAVSLDLPGPFTTASFHATPVSGGTDVTLACFVAGTRIRTARGAIAVERLRAGSRVVTASGATRPVVWIGHRRLDPRRHPAPHQVRPVLIVAHAFGNGVPCRDLRLSPDHAVFVDGVLIPVKHLVNGSTIVRLGGTRAVTYFHVELDRHDVLLAEDLPVESYLDTGGRAMFENGGSPLLLHPDFAVRAWEAGACARLVVTGPELQAARQRLSVRAAELGRALG